uniref:Uncharacterized protein n=1 Tax=Triticum urartu TaxID=4572 RepID=A0A8R7PCJ1_TRIUA
MGSRKEREGGTTGVSGGRPHRSPGRRLGKGRWWAAPVDRRPTPNHELSRSSPLSPASSGRGGRVRRGELVLVSASSAPVLLLPTPAAQPCVPPSWGTSGKTGSTRRWGASWWWWVVARDPGGGRRQASMGLADPGEGAAVR